MSKRKGEETSPQLLTGARMTHTQPQTNPNCWGTTRIKTRGRWDLGFSQNVKHHCRIQKTTAGAMGFVISSVSNDTYVGEVVLVTLAELGKHVKNYKSSSYGTLLSCPC